MWYLLYPTIWFRQEIFQTTVYLYIIADEGYSLHEELKKTKGTRLKRGKDVVWLGGGRCSMCVCTLEDNAG